MFNSKQKYYFLLLVFLLVPFAVKAAWTEPSQAPTGGNAAVPIYSEGSGQTLNGTLHVDPTATNPTSLQGSGSTNGIQGNSVGNALFGNLTANGAAGGRAVYGLAVDTDDYGLYASGGLGIGIATGDIYYLQQNSGIAWPRESDSASLYGVQVNNSGELRLYGHGGGINFLDQNQASRLTVSEAGATNVVTGPLTVGGTAVCLSSGAGCPAPPPPPAGSDLWNPNGNDIYPNFSGAVKLNHDLQFNGDTAANAIIDFDPYEGNLGNYFLIQSGISPTYGEKWHLRVNRTGETLLGGNLFVGTGGGVASMTPYNDPTVNASWKIGLVGGVNTIEATPGGGAGSVGDINLKSGTLKLKYLNSDAGDVMVNDALDVQYGIKNSNADNGGTVYINDDLKVASKASFGGWNPDPFFTVTTPTIYSDQGSFTKVKVGNPTGGWLTGTPPPPPQTGGFVNAEMLCMQGDCKSSWAAAAAGTQNLLQVLQTSADAAAFAGPTSIGGNVNVGIGQTARLHVKATGNLEALRVVSGLWSPFIVRNSADNADLFRVDQNGNVGIGGVAVPLSNKLTVNGDVVFTGGGVFAFQMEGNAIIQGTVAAPDVVAGTSVTSPLLKIETPQGGNAETRIQSNLSSYWAIYQDDTTDELRFWNNNVAVGDKNVLKVQTDGAVRVPNKLVIGNMASNPYMVTETFAGETALGIKAPNGAALAYFGANPFPGFSTPSVTITSDLYFSDTSGNFTGFIANNGGVPVQAQFGTVGATTITATNFCFGATCKSSTWGPPNGAYNGQVPNQFTNDADTQYVQLQSTDGQNYWCPLGWVMIGIRNTNPAHLICGRMY